MVIDSGRRPRETERKPSQASCFGRWVLFKPALAAPLFPQCWIFSPSIDARAPGMIGGPERTSSIIVVSWPVQFLPRCSALSLAGS